MENAERRPRVNLIWAQAHDANWRGIIGRDGGMPWHLPEDLRKFRQLTYSHPTIMGRRTWESLPEDGRPLKGRDNIVITHDRDYTADGATVADSLETALLEASSNRGNIDGIDRREIWVIGGAAIFSQAMRYADQLYVTYIDMTVEGDTYAPMLNPCDWRVLDDSDWAKPADGNNPVPRFRFTTYERTCPRASEN